MPVLADGNFPVTDYFVKSTYGVKKIFDANYGEVNTYHRDTWEAAYPEYEI